MGKPHPEGLTFEPKGHGFTTSIERLPFTVPTRLLSAVNIAAARKNHSARWQEAFAELPVRQRDRRTGRFTQGFTEDERERLATLAMFVEGGLFHDDDGHVTVGDRIPEPHGKSHVRTEIADGKR